MSKTNPTKQHTNPKENTMSDRRENLKTVYNFVVANWATDKAEIESAKIVAGGVDSLLKTLERKGLLASTHVNGEKKLTWQSMFDIENEADVLERSAAAFDAAFPVKQAEPATSDRTHATGPRYTDEQLARAAELKAGGMSWPKIASELGIKAPYRLKMRVERDLGPVAPIAGNDPLVDTYVELLEAALAEKRTSGPLKARIREALGK